VGKDVLQAISQLEGVHVAEAVLDMRVNDQLCQAKDFTTELKGKKKRE